MGSTSRYITYVRRCSLSLDILGAAFLTLITSALVMQSTRMFEPIAKLVFKMYALVARRILS